jgi:hypothetical protein
MMSAETSYTSEDEVRRAMERGTQFAFVPDKDAVAALARDPRCLCCRTETDNKWLLDGVPPVPIPYCERCAAHVERAQRASPFRSIVLAVLATTVVLAGIFAALPGCPRALYLALGCALCAVFEPVLHTRTLRPARGCCSLHLAVTLPLRKTECVVRHPAVAFALLRSTNPALRLSTTALPPDRGRWTAGVVLGAMAGAVVGTLFAYGVRGKVYFDNPLEVPVVFDVGPGLLRVEVPAGGRSEARVPTGPRAVRLLRPGRPAEQWSAWVDPISPSVALVLTSSAQTCYALHDVHYARPGAGSTGHDGVVRYYRGGHAYVPETAWVFEVPPGAIQSQSSTTTLTLFDRWTCPDERTH